MTLTLNGIETTFQAQDRWLDLIARLPDGGESALGVAVAGETCALAELAQEGVDARVLTFADEEGRRIYERSLQMLFLAALHHVDAGAHARIEHSLGAGLVIRVTWTDGIPRWDDVRDRMRTLAALRLPIDVKLFTKDEADAYFARTGQEERVRLNRWRAFEHFTLYRVDGYEDYFYGKMVPDTGCVRAFDLIEYDGGAVLMQPDPEDPSRSAPFCALPKLMTVYNETARWQAILDCANVADLNDMIENRRLREFIRVNEALQEHRIAEIARQFIESGARLMLIAGPSSSGKTTFAHRLAIALRVHGLKPVKLSLDDYYRSRHLLKREPDGSLDLERLDTLDVELLNEHLPKLLAGETVQLPVYDFKTGTRSERTHDMTLAKGQPLIIEGIHGLNDELTSAVSRDQKFKIYISALTMLNLDDHNRIRTTDARLLRRIVRDHLFRGTPPEETMAMRASVRRGEENYIFPWQEEADAMFNSSLSYELPIMKRYAYPRLKEIAPTSPYYTLAMRLVKFLNYIQEADVEDEIPVNSILREFIGGCCFYREDD